MAYCIEQNGVIVNIVEATPQYAASQGWIANDGWGIGWVRSGQTFVPPEQQEPADPIPTQCTRRQGLLALLSYGIKRSDIEAQIEAMDNEMQREAAWIEYLSDTWERSNPVVQQMWQHLGGQPEQLDDLFILAVTL